MVLETLLIVSQQKFKTFNIHKTHVRRNKSNYVSIMLHIME